MAELFQCFPHLVSERLIIRKMTEDDIDSLSEITNNENVYRYIPLFLYKKSRGNLLAAIRNLGGRDFDKKKMIVAGIYLSAEPDRLIGLAEMFDYKKRTNQITIGYRINEAYWHRGIATETVALLIAYLCDDIGIQTIKAFVMPENKYSERVLMNNGFTKDKNMVQGKNWGGKEVVGLHVFNSTLHAGEIKSYIQLCLAISHQALVQRGASRSKTQSSNEKYTFRTWLLRLGLIGNEFKTARLHLLKNLDGNIAWRDLAQAGAQKERLAAKRLAEQREAMQEENEYSDLVETDEEPEDEQDDEPAFFMSM